MIENFNTKTKVKIFLSKSSIFLLVTEIRNINWEINHVLLSSCLKEVNNPSVRLSFEVKESNSQESRLNSFDMTPGKFQVLMHGRY